jgi:hypothetical protein
MLPILLTCRDLLNQTYKEGRILLTRDAKLLKYQYLAGNQVYRVKSLLKHDQLAEVCIYFDLFHLKYDLYNIFHKLMLNLPWLKVMLVILLKP